MDTWHRVRNHRVVRALLAYVEQLEEPQDVKTELIGTTLKTDLKVGG